MQNCSLQRALALSSRVLLLCLVMCSGFAIAAVVNAALEFRPNQRIQSETKYGETADFRIYVKAGSYVELYVSVMGSDVEISVIGPGQLQALRAPVSTGQDRRIPIVSGVDGDLSFEVRNSWRDTQAKISLEIKQLRPATSKDSLLAKAASLLFAGEELLKSSSAETQQQALKSFEAAASQASMAGDSQLQAEAFAKLGETRMNRSEYRESLKYLNSSLAIWETFGDLRGKSQVQDLIGQAYFNLGDRSKALSWLEEALQTSRAANFARGEAGSLNDLGVVLGEIGNHQEAMPNLNSALQIYQRLGDIRGQGETLTNLGHTYDFLGMEKEAVGSFEHALPLLRSTGDRYSEAAALNDLAHAYSVLGEKQRSLDLYDQSLSIEQEVRDRQGEANTLMNTAKILDDLGDRGSALTYYKRELVEARRIGDRQLEAVAQARVAGVQEELGNNETALIDYRRSAALSRTVRDRRWEATALNDMGNIYSQAGREQMALSYYREALALRRDIQDPSAISATLSNIAKVQISQSRVKDAWPLLEEAGTLAHSAGDKNAEAIVLYEKAEVQEQEGDLTSATSSIDEAVNIIESLRSRVAVQDLRSSYLAAVRQYFDLYIEILMQLHRLHPEDGYGAKALEICERGRARTLLEAIREGNVSIRQGVDPALLERERSLSAQIDSYVRRSLQHSKEKAAFQSGQDPDELIGLKREYRQVQAKIRETSPNYAALSQPLSISANHIQQGLEGTDTVVLEYALGKVRSFVWALTANNISVFDLPSRDVIEPTARSFYSGIVGLNSGSSVATQNSAFRLANMIVAPLAHLLQDRRIVVIGDGALTLVPFAALPDPAAGPEKKSH